MTSEDEFGFPAPSIDPIATDGNTSCGNSNADFTQVCGRPGEWHVMWGSQGDGMEASFACHEHMQVILSKLVFHSRHKVGADCNMPGAQFHHGLNKCVVVSVREVPRDEQA